MDDPASSQAELANRPRRALGRRFCRLRAVALAAPGALSSLVLLAGIAVASLATYAYTALAVSTLTDGLWAGWLLCLGLAATIPIALWVGLTRGRQLPRATRLFVTGTWLMTLGAGLLFLRLLTSPF